MAKNSENFKTELDAIIESLRMIGDGLDGETITSTIQGRLGELAKMALRLRRQHSPKPVFKTTTTETVPTDPALAELNERLALVRDRVRGVAKQGQAGFYLYGRAGTSKTYTVRTTLDELGVKYQYQNGHITPIGLFETFEEHPDGIIVLDDVGEIFKQPTAKGILLAALGSQPNGVREIRYKRQGVTAKVRFRGGVIAISNLELHGDELIAAIKSRVQSLNYNPTDDQISALMRQIAAKGHQLDGEKMSPKECEKVCDFLLERFPARCPYGYRNIRTNGRATAEVHPDNGHKVQRAFELRAYEGLLVEQIVERLYMEGLFYTSSKPRFPETKMYAILHDLSYTGFVKYQGQWHPGLHESLIDKVTWDLVRVSFGDQSYRSHEMVYANQLIRCGHCGHPITGEEKTKDTKSGPKKYVYYRCARYQRHGHPRVRLREHELDIQARHLLAEFMVIRPDMQRLIVNIAVSRLEQERISSEVRGEEVKRQLSLIEGQREELLNLRLAKAIADEKFSAKQAELEERETLIRRQVQMMDELRSQNDALAKRAPEVFEQIQQDWDTLGFSAKQDILRLLFTGFVLDDRTLVTGDRTPLELFRAG